MKLIFPFAFFLIRSWGYNSHNKNFDLYGFDKDLLVLQTFPTGFLISKNLTETFPETSTAHTKNAPEMSQKTLHKSSMNAPQTLPKPPKSLHSLKIKVFFIKGVVGPFKELYKAA